MTRMGPSHNETEKIDMVQERVRLQMIQELGGIDVPAGKFPCCLVWTPLPVIAWLVPFIGHLGICREDGVILDFAGSYFISVDNFTFGAPARYVRLNPAECCFPPNPSSHNCRQAVTHDELGSPQSWDHGLQSTMRHFQNHTYNLFMCNCHSFVASCLNAMAYRGRCDWNVFQLIYLLAANGHWVSTISAVRAFAPFFIIAATGYATVGWSFFWGWAMFAVIITGWFAVGTYLIPGLVRIKGTPISLQPI